MSKKLKLDSKNLSVEIDADKVALAVTEKRSKVRWEMFPSYDYDVVLRFADGHEETRTFSSSKDKRVRAARHGLKGHELSLADLGLVLTFFLVEDDLVVEIAPARGWRSFKVRDVRFPRHFVLPRKEGAYTLWTVGQGSIVPATWHGRFHHPEGYSEQEMCFHGARQDGCGMVAIAETPYDMYIAMDHREGAAPSTFIRWLPSHGCLRYPRRVRFHFEPGMDFVGMAKAYRKWIDEEGYFKPLSEKVKENPNVARLKGAAVVCSQTATRRVRTMQYECTSFDEQAKRLAKLKERTGLKRAVVHVDGWGRFGYDSVHPETLPPNQEAGGAPGLKRFREKARELGWLFGLHDQYIDVYTDAPSYAPERLMIKEDGKPNLVNMWAGGLCSHMCYSESLKFVRRNIIEGVHDQYMYHNSPPVMQICAPDAYYLDCFCRLHECFNPLHPMTRQEVAETNVEIFRTVRHAGEGVVLSCEHPKFYAVPELDFGWSVGHLTADVQVVGGGHSTECVGIPVPLFLLVFHDAVWLPHPGGDLLQAFLYVRGPYFWNTAEGPSDGEIETKMKLCKLNEAAGFDEMVGFKVLDAGGREMESEFSSGLRVRVDYEDRTYRVSGGKGADMEGKLEQ